MNNVDISEVSEVSEVLNKMRKDVSESINNMSKAGKVDISEAINKMDLGSFVVNTTKVFSEQVTEVCVVTLRPLFDADKALAIREYLKRSFDAIIETIDEEIEEFGIGDIQCGD